MAIQTAAMKNALADRYAALATHGAIYSTVPGATAGTAIGAREPLTWAAAANGVTTATAVFDVPAGETVRGAGVHSALTAGTYYDGAAVTEQAFASAGTYTVTYTFTQS